MALANKYSVYFGGKIIEATVTDKASVADDWVQNIQSLYNGQLHIAGLDCKFKPHPIRSLSNKIATLQICIDTKCLVLQLLHIDYIPESIKSFLGDPKITFGVEVRDNSLKLWTEYELFVGKKVDIRALVKMCFPISFPGKSSMRALAYGLAGLAMRETNKPYVCDWGSRVLDMQMMEHALAIQALAMDRWPLSFIESLVSKNWLMKWWDLEWLCLFIFAEVIGRLEILTRPKLSILVLMLMLLIELEIGSLKNCNVIDDFIFDFS